MNLMQYQGFYGSIEVSLEDGCLFGKLEFIDPLVSYEGETVQELETAFREAVEDYLGTCQQQGVEPQQPYGDTLKVRIGRKLHQEAGRVAALRGESLHDFVKAAVEHEINRSP